MSGNPVTDALESGDEIEAARLAMKQDEPPPEIVGPYLDHLMRLHFPDTPNTTDPAMPGEFYDPDPPSHDEVMAAAEFKYGAIQC